MTTKIFFKNVSFAVVGAAATIFIAVKPVSANDRLTVVTWGGAYTKSQVLAYFRPYRARTGVRFNIEDYNGGLAQIEAQVDSLNIKWDVVDLTLSDAIRGCEQGLLEEFDHSILPPAPDGIPAGEDFLEGTLTRCGVGEILWSTVIAYDATKFADEKPFSITDFWDIKKFPGKRAMRKVPQKNLEWALIADGVPTGEVYEVLATPEGVDRAFKSLDKIKTHLVWWETGAQPPQMLAAGEVTMTTGWNGRIYDVVVNKGKPFTIIWNESIWDIDLWGIVKETPNLKEAIEFVKFATDTQRLADQTKYISYGPARKSSMALVGENVKRHLPTAPDNFRNAIQFNSRWWADHQEEMNARFAAWLAEPTAKPEQLPR